MLEGDSSQSFTLPSFTILRFSSAFETAQQGSDAWIAVTYPEQKGLCAASNVQGI